MTKSTTKENQKLNEAIIFAVNQHAGQLRKGSSKPYIVHPIEVFQLLYSMKADTNLIIAGLLHDTVEDTGATVDEIRERFGEDVATLVAAHSEDKSKTWDERKISAIEELETADKRLKMLVMADKLSNMRSIESDYNEIGEDLWNRFNAPFEKQKWYYTGIKDALESMSTYPETRKCYEELAGIWGRVFGK
ncbi:MAG: HD domain-containing protein [Oscillospiraceae bacterium]|nr:HD domain-containing protein [Oscillospiraceae bacterium]